MILLLCGVLLIGVGVGVLVGLKVGAWWQRENAADLLMALAAGGLLDPRAMEFGEDPEALRRFMAEFSRDRAAWQ